MKCVWNVLRSILFFRYKQRTTTGDKCIIRSGGSPCVLHVYQVLRYRYNVRRYVLWKWLFHANVTGREKSLMICLCSTWYQYEYSLWSCERIIIAVRTRCCRVCHVPSTRRHPAHPRVRAESWSYRDIWCTTSSVVTKPQHRGTMSIVLMTKGSV